MTLLTAPRKSPAQRDSKATLFCPNCGHESSVDGDWIADDTTARDRRLCPRCGETVVDRPTF